MDRKEFLKKMGLLMAGAVAVDLTAKANSKTLILRCCISPMNHVSVAMRCLMH